MLTDTRVNKRNHLGVRTDKCQITAIANQKGGVGKTTTALNLGVALARMGRRTLLVDMDPQASLSASLGVPIQSLDSTIYNLLMDSGAPVETTIYSTSSNVDILPSNIDLAAAEIELVSATLREFVLRDVLHKVADRYDHIIIDCPPSLGLLTINALAASHRVVIPLQCEFLATRGMALLLSTLEKLGNRVNPDLTIAGILPTMYDARTVHGREVLAELHSTFGTKVYPTPIKDTVKLKESPAAALSVLDYDPAHDVAKAYYSVAKELDNA